MSSVVSAITNTIPISNFNRGLAGKIFADVRSSGAKVVIKNNMPECVLISPEEYIDLMNELEDAKLLALALSRIEEAGDFESVPITDIIKKYGISQKELDLAGEVEFE